MKITRMMAGVYAANCYLIFDEERKKGFIIDPGGDFEDIVKRIEKADFKPEFILLTHGHGDHIGAVLELKEKYGIDLYCHEDETELLYDPKKNLSQRMPMGPVSLEADHTFTDQEILFPESYNIKVIHTPGHTDGSVCFLMNKDLFSGDTLFKGSVGRTDLFAGSKQKLDKSLMEKIYTLEDNITVHSGHGGESSIGYEKKTNPFLQF